MGSVHLEYSGMGASAYRVPCSMFLLALAFLFLVAQNYDLFSAGRQKLPASWHSFVALVLQLFFSIIPTFVLTILSHLSKLARQRKVHLSFFDHSPHYVL